MIFSPVVPRPGIAGWRFLERTYDAQLQTYARDPTLTRETEIFRRDIGTVKNAGELVANRTLLQVALGAFGLQADINNRFFIQKVLEDGTSNSDALANRLSDRRYRQFSDAFGFGPTAGRQTNNEPAMKEIAEAYC